MLLLFFQVNGFNKKLQCVCEVIYKYRRYKRRLWVEICCVVFFNSESDRQVFTICDDIVDGVLLAVDPCRLLIFPGGRPLAGRTWLSPESCWRTQLRSRQWLILFGEIKKIIYMVIRPPQGIMLLSYETILGWKWRGSILWKCENYSTVL